MTTSFWKGFSHLVITGLWVFIDVLTVLLVDFSLFRRFLLLLLLLLLHWFRAMVSDVVLVGVLDLDDAAHLRRHRFESQFTSGTNVEIFFSQSCSSSTSRSFWFRRRRRDDEGVVRGDESVAGVNDLTDQDGNFEKVLKAYLSSSLRWLERSEKNWLALSNFFSKLRHRFKTFVSSFSASWNFKMTFLFLLFPRTEVQLPSETIFDWCWSNDRKCPKDRSNVGLSPSTNRGLVGD